MADDAPLVRDVMTDGVITCNSDATLASVAMILAAHRIHAVFVLDDAGAPAGVLSDFDLLAGEWLADDAEGLKTMQAVTAGELMTRPAETIGESEPASAATSRLRELHLARLLVVDAGGSPVGVISVSDLVAPLGKAPVERQTVRDVMSHAIVTCRADTPLAAAARAMTERRSRSVVVLGENGSVAGVITGADLLNPRSASTVGELMTAPITCEPDLALADAADLILRHEVHRLIVVDSKGVPLGMLSTSDIVAEMAQVGSVWQARS
jgi:CBS-domain-containing membrane protein